MTQLWSWGLTALGFVATIYIGRKNPVGWLIAFLAQGVWIAFAVATNQYGFIASSLMYALMNWRNWRSWRKAEQPEAGLGSRTDSVEEQDMERAE